MRTDFRVFFRSNRFTRFRGATTVRTDPFNHGFLEKRMKKYIYGLIAGCLALAMASPASAMSTTVSSGPVAAPSGTSNIAPALAVASGSTGTFQVSLTDIISTGSIEGTFEVEGFSQVLSGSTAANSLSASFSVDALTLAGFDLSDGLDFSFASINVDSGTFNASLTYTAVPEPSSIALIAIGSLVGGGAFLRRRRSAGL